MVKKSTDYLSYIEDTPKHHDKLAALAKKASRGAIQKALKSNESISYLKGDKFVQCSDTGKEMVIG